MAEVPRLHVGAGDAVGLLVLATSSVGLVGVDLASGALLRSRWGGPALRPYDVVTAWLGEPDVEPDPARPDEVVFDAFRPEGHLGWRRAERLLRPLLHPGMCHLLGFAGPAIPLWRLDGDRPSVAVVSAPTQVGLDADGSPRARFRWMGLPHDLPVAALPGSRLPPAAPRFVVALGAPHEGHCYKAVAGLLPH